MKKLLFSLILLLVSYVGFSQKGLSYQAVVLDPNAIEIPGQDISGQPLVNGDVWMKFSIYNGSTLQFEEVQKTKTDAYGLVNLMIGSVSTASFNSLTWDGVQKSMQVFVSFNQGASYTKVSDQKLNYNPYALYAETAGKLGGVLGIAGGGTGATTAASARASLGLGNVENTSDAEKPISSATKAALDLKVNSSDVTTALALKANSADVNSALAAKVDSAFVLAKVAAATIADADTSTKGKIQLAGDLGGTAAAPTVPGLALKANTADITAALALKANSADVNSALAAKVDSAFVLAKVVATSIADADATTKGKVQLAGDLSGTAAAPTVPGLALKANTADVNTSLDTKVDKVTGKDLSSNDYTTPEKDKLAAITGTNTGDQINITGNAATATKLATAKNINGVAFDGSADITVTTDAGTLTGTTLASNVVNSSLTSVGTLTSGSISLTTDIVTSGNLKAGDITYPNTAGTNGQVLTSNGAGNATWLSPTSVSVGTISSTSNANGATITSGVLNLTPADETNGGIITTGTQSFAGLKTFNDGINYIKVSSSSTLDQRNITSTGSSLGQSVWQSFTAGISGILSSVEWEIQGQRTSITVIIYNGEGINGTLLGTANGMTSTTRSFVAFDLSSSNIKVIASQKYTIQVTTSLNNFSSINSSNPYANGRASANLNWDFVFKTYVKAFSTDSYLPLSGGALTGNLSTSGTITSGTVTFPSAHGLDGQVLSTTGSGTLTWTNSTAPANETNGGIVSTGTQTFAGLKTFNDGINYIKVNSSPALDQSSTDVNGGAGGTSQWQSFTAGVNGILSSVEWNMGSPLNSATAASVTVKIYDGEGTNGTLLGTSNGMTPATNNFNAFEYVAFDLSNSNIKVIAGQRYTIQLTTSAVPNAFLSLSYSNPYANGRSSYDPNWDFLFKTYVRATSTDSYLPLSGGALTGNLSTSGTLTAGAVTYPNTHGTEGQVLTSTGSGTLAWTTPSSVSGGTHTLGELYGGGIVFYVTADGLHGLIAETVDQSTSSPWFDAQDIISTSSISTSHSPEGALFTDWRLPTRNELNLMYTNIGPDTQYANISGFSLGGSAPAIYWSSTKAPFPSPNFTIYCVQDYSDGAQDYLPENNSAYVRAIRSF